MKTKFASVNAQCKFSSAKLMSFSFASLYGICVELLYHAKCLPFHCHLLPLVPVVLYICIWKLCLHMCQDSYVSKCWNDSGKWQQWKIDLNFPSVCVTAIDCSLWKLFNAKLSLNVSCEIGGNNFKQFLTQILPLYSIFVNIILSKSSRINCKLKKNLILKLYGWLLKIASTRRKNEVSIFRCSLFTYLQLQLCPSFSLI